MKKVLILLLSLLLLVFATACSKEAAVKNTVEGSKKTYYEMTDGTYRCEDRTYKKMLELSGRIPNAEVDTTYVYLTNIEDMTFEQAWKASGLSSDTKDYFKVEDAVLVDVRD